MGVRPVTFPVALWPVRRSNSRRNRSCTETPSPIVRNGTFVCGAVSTAGNDSHGCCRLVCAPASPTIVSPPSPLTPNAAPSCSPVCTNSRRLTCVPSSDIAFLLWHLVGCWLRRRQQVRVGRRPGDSQRSAMARSGSPEAQALVLLDLEFLVRPEVQDHQHDAARVLETLDHSGHHVLGSRTTGIDRPHRICADDEDEPLPFGGDSATGFYSKDAMAGLDADDAIPRLGD